MALPSFLNFLYWFLNPVFDILLALGILAFVAWKAGQIKLSLITIGTGLTTFAVDMLAPPFSACDFALPGQEAIAKSLQNIRLTDDLFSCSFAKAIGNWTLFKLDLPFQISLWIPLFILFGTVFAILMVLSLKFPRPELWLTLFAFMGYWILMAYSIDGVLVNSIYITAAGLFTLFIVPAAAWFGGTYILWLSTQYL